MAASLRSSLSMNALLERQLEADGDNPRLLMLVGNMCLRHRSYERANVLFGRAIHLGLKNAKVYTARGECLMKVAETLSLLRVEEAMPRFLTASQMFDSAIECGVGNSGTGAVQTLLHSARAVFRCGDFHRAAQLLGVLVEELSKHEHQTLARQHMTEVALMASQSLHEIQQVKDALRYMMFAFNSTHEVHSLRDGTLGHAEHSGDYDDGDDDDDDVFDDGDLFEIRRGVPSEHACALVLGLLTHLSGSSTGNMKHSKRFDLEAAVQYSFFRHKAASFAADKWKRRALGHMQNGNSAVAQQCMKSVSGRKSAKVGNATTWSKRALPWIESGNAFLRKGHHVFAKLCYAEAVSRTQGSPFPGPVSQRFHDIQNFRFRRFEVPPGSIARTRLAESIYLCAEREEAIRYAQKSYGYFRWSLSLRRMLLAWEPKTWSRLFTLQDMAAVLIQSFARGMIIRQAGNVERAARTIQSYWRMLLAYVDFRHHISSVVGIQSAWRGARERMGLVWKQRRLEAAATKIEAAWRGCHGRLQARLERYKQFEFAFRLIARVGRGHIGRQRWRDRYRACQKMQSVWRGYHCRLTMYAIGVLPLVQWTQVGSCFVPVTFIRRAPTWKVNYGGTSRDGKLLAPAPKKPRRKGQFYPDDGIDLTIVGRKLEANAQSENIHGRTLVNRVKRIDARNELQIARNAAWNEMAEAEHHEAMAQISKEEEDIRNDQEAEIEDYLKSVQNLRQFKMTAEADLDRARRRLKAATSRWLDKLAEAQATLSEYGHHEITFWRARIRLHLEACVLTLKETYGEETAMILGSQVEVVAQSLNENTSAVVRASLHDLMKRGERFERRHNHQWRVLEDEFRGAKRRLRHAVKAMLALRRRVAKLNENRQHRRGMLSHGKLLDAGDSMILRNEEGNPNLGGSDATSQAEDPSPSVKKERDSHESSEEAVTGSPEERLALKEEDSRQFEMLADSKSLTPSSKSDKVNEVLFNHREKTQKHHPLDAMNSSIDSLASTANPNLHSSLNDISTVLSLHKPQTGQQKKSARSIEESRLRKRVDVLVHRIRTRENEDHIVAEYLRVLARCSHIGLWQLALECHICMAKQDLPRDSRTYRQVVTALKNSPQPVPIQVTNAILDEMIDEGLATQTTFHVCMGAISRVRQCWRHAVIMFGKMRSEGHKASSATYEILTQALSEADPTDAYDAMKFCGVPEFFAYSISRRALEVRDRMKQEEIDKEVKQLLAT